MSSLISFPVSVELEGEGWEEGEQGEEEGEKGEEEGEQGEGEEEQGEELKH